MKTRRKYHGFIPKAILLILLVIGSLSTNFDKSQNHIMLADKYNNVVSPISSISKCVREIDVSNATEKTYKYDLRNYDESSKNLLIKSSEAYYTLILTDLQELKNVVTLLHKKNIRLIDNIIIIGANSNVLKSIKYKNMYLLNDESNLDLTLSTLGKESKLQSLSIHYNKNTEPSTKVVVRTQSNTKPVIHKSLNSRLECTLTSIILLTMLILLVDFLYCTFKKSKQPFYMIKELLQDTCAELNSISVIFAIICWGVLGVAIYILNGYDINKTFLCIFLVVTIFILFIIIIGTKSSKLLKSINEEKFNNIRTTIFFLFWITAYCTAMTMCLNSIDTTFSNIEQKAILLISSLCLIIAYMFNMQILYNLIIHRYKIVKRSTPKEQFFNFCFLSIIVIVCFIGIFTSANLLSLYIDPNTFKDDCSIFNVVYYSASTFLTFCSENISAHTSLSKLICLLSKITTIISITVLISVLTGLLPEDENNSGDNPIKNMKHKKKKHKK